MTPSANAHTSMTATLRRIIPAPRMLSIGTVTLASALLLTALPAQAYVGPGAGLSLLSALWAVLAAILVAVGFILMWPLRKMMRKRKNTRMAAKNGTADSAEHSNS